MKILSNHKAAQLVKLLTKDVLSEIRLFVMSLIDYGNPLFCQTTSDESLSIIKMAIEFIGNIFSSDNSDDIVNHFIQNNLSGHLAIMLDGEDPQIKKSILWIYSNMVTSTTQAQNEK